MTQDLPLTLRSSPRARLRELTDEFFDVDSEEPWRIPDLIDQITSQVDTEDFVRRPLLRQVIDVFVREYVNQRLARTRGLLLMGDEIVTPQQFERRVAKRTARIAHWRERVGAVQVPLLQMVKSELLVAASERHKMAMSHLHIGALWHKLAEGMDDQQTVGDRYTAEDIALLADKLKVSVLIEDTDGPSIQGQPKRRTVVERKPSSSGVRLRAPAAPRLKQPSA